VSWIAKWFVLIALFFKWQKRKWMETSWNRNYSSWFLAILITKGSIVYRIDTSQAFEVRALVWEWSRFIFGDLSQAMVRIYFAFQVLRRLFSSRYLLACILGTQKSITPSLGMARTHAPLWPESFLLLEKYLGQTEATLVVRPFIPNHDKVRAECAWMTGEMQRLPGVLVQVCAFLVVISWEEQSKSLLTFWKLVS